MLPPNQKPLRPILSKCLNRRPAGFLYGWIIVKPFDHFGEALLEWVLGPPF
jgi:hypothetical protein